MYNTFIVKYPPHRKRCTNINKPVLIHEQKKIGGKDEKGYVHELKEEKREDKKDPLVRGMLGNKRLNYYLPCLRIGMYV